MSVFIEPQTNLSTAWLGAMKYLVDQPGREATNLIVTIQPPLCEDNGIRELVDGFVAQHLRVRNNIRKVADTIFKIDCCMHCTGSRNGQFYFPPGALGRKHIYAEHMDAFQIEKQSYVKRLICWDQNGGSPINQLEAKIVRMRKLWIDRRHRKGNDYELGVRTISDQDGFCSGDVVNEDLHIFDPSKHKPRSIPGFPCLSHISLTLTGGRLVLTALYRNQYFLLKAYGNLLGLKYLQSFICREVGCEIGELVCIATHACIAEGENCPSIMELSSLVRRCESAIGNRSSGAAKAA